MVWSSDSRAEHKRLPADPGRGREGHAGRGAGPPAGQDAETLPHQRVQPGGVRSDIGEPISAGRPAHRVSVHPSADCVVATWPFSAGQ